MALLFFDISSGELLVILAAIFLIFGPKKIPEIARKIGKGVNEIKKVSNDIRDEIKTGFDNNVRKEVENVVDKDLKAEGQIKDENDV